MGDLPKSTALMPGSSPAFPPFGSRSGSYRDPAPLFSPGARTPLTSTGFPPTPGLPPTPGTAFTNTVYPTPAAIPQTPGTAPTPTVVIKSYPRKSLPQRLGSFLYHSSFWLFIVIIAALLVGAAWGLGEQAWRTAGKQRRWNLVVQLAAYVALGVISVAHAWSRFLSIKRILRTMPKPYIPNKPVDLPEKAANHIMTEYSRTAVISHISQATTGRQEGWGRPGTKWEDKHFRNVILATLPEMRETLAPRSTAPPLSLDPLFAGADALDALSAPPPAPSPFLDPPDPFSPTTSTQPTQQTPKTASSVRIMVNTYAQYIERARYGKREPGEREAEMAEKVVGVVKLLAMTKRAKAAALNQQNVQQQQQPRQGVRMPNGVV
ncbi:hypothetical protein IAT38_001738 [Cryptococcus sp. DSM 104549]